VDLIEKHWKREPLHASSSQLLQNLSQSFYSSLVWSRCFIGPFRRGCTQLVSLGSSTPVAWPSALHTSSRGAYTCTPLFGPQLNGFVPYPAHRSLPRQTSLTTPDPNPPLPEQRPLLGLPGVAPGMGCMGCLDRIGAWVRW
jgi:hypothetical protein